MDSFDETAALQEALNRIVGMTECWGDENGRTEEIYASKIAREALAQWEGGGGE